MPETTMTIEDQPLKPEQIDEIFEFLSEKPEIVNLNLINCDLSADFIQALSEKIPSTNIEHLGLSNNKLNPRCAEILCQIRGLDSLDVSNNRIGAKGLKHFAEATFKSINLKNNLVMVNDGHALDGIADNPHIESLDLTCNFLGPNSGAVLARSTSLKRLKAVSCHLGDRGAEVFASSSLEFLDITNNDISPDGVRALSTTTTLKELVINRNQVKDAGLAFVDHPTLRRLNLGYTNLTEDCILPLANSNLAFISFEDQPVDSEIVEALVQNPSMTSVDLTRCSLTAECIDILCNSEKTRTLILKGNDLDEDTALKFTKAKGIIETLDLRDNPSLSQEVLDTLSKCEHIHNVLIGNEFSLEEVQQNSSRPSQGGLFATTGPMVSNQQPTDEKSSALSPNT